MLFHNVQMRPIAANCNGSFIFNASGPYDSIDLRHMNMVFFIGEISHFSVKYRMHLRNIAFIGTKEGSILLQILRQKLSKQLAPK